MHHLLEGFSDVYQLDGGILRYFERCGGAHWRGDCFVFDDRVALTPSLAEAQVQHSSFNPCSGAALFLLLLLLLLLLILLLRLLRFNAIISR